MCWPSLPITKSCFTSWFHQCRNVHISYIWWLPGQWQATFTKLLPLLEVYRERERERRKSHRHSFWIPLVLISYFTTRIPPLVNPLIGQSQTMMGTTFHDINNIYFRRFIRWSVLNKICWSRLYDMLVVDPGIVESGRGITLINTWIIRGESSSINSWSKCIIITL
jgi:hypothetical protein